MENLVGQTLNRYQIKSLLGEGGMGAVYRAYDTTLQRDVAIKVMHPHFARQPNFQERFLQEARTAARLSHPGIVQIHDFGSYHAQLYIVMKFIPGDNLEEMLRQLRARDRWIPLGEAVQLVRQAALALNYAHRQGVLHRDIKPGNIMLEPEPADGLPYRPVVTDLGLAKLVQGGMMTQDGQSMGTPAYMSPEQAQGAPTDARSDVYSLGILLYELATGRLPFNPRTLTEAIQMHVHTPPATPRSLRAEIPEALERVILQAIQKDPARRFQNAQALADALAQVYPSTSGVNAPPRGVGATLSLMTQWQNSLAEPRGPSVFEDTSAGYAADPSGRDRIEILAGDQTTHTVAFRPPAMTIGRDPDSDLFVDDPKVSRQHARVEFDGQSFRVTDLNSTNGSFLDGRRLHGGVPQAWHPGQTLSVGAAHLRLLRPGMPPGGETAPAAGATLRGDSPYLAYPSGGTTRAAAGPAPVFGFDSRMEPPHLAAGEIGRVTIHNGGAADRFSIHWLSPGDELDFTPPNLQVDVAAGQELVAEFRAEPRRSAWIGGGRSYPFSAQVSPGSGVPQMHHGELSARAALPGWAIPLLLVLCLALVGGLLLLSDMVFGSGAGLTLGNASATDAFARTQVALAVEGTRAAGSATALAIQGANQATQQAAEQTLQAQAALSSATAAAAATAQAATVTAMQSGAQTALALTSTAQVATLQAGVSGTAAAQATAQAATQAAAQAGELTQTAVAAGITQQAAAAQTAAAATAIAAQQTGQAQSATLTANALRRAAYVYKDDFSTASDYATFLQGQGYQVDLLTMDQIFGANFSLYKVILIGPETGNSPGDNPWGDAAEAQAGYIASAGRPVVGLGRGGTYFFEALGGLTITQGNSWSWSANAKEGVAQRPNAPYWDTPFNVSLPGNQVIKLYDQDQQFHAIYLPGPIAGVTPIVGQVDDSEHFQVIRDGPRFLLWGYTLGPEQMSNKGQRLFLNLLWNLAP